MTKHEPRDRHCEDSIDGELNLFDGTEQQQTREPDKRDDQASNKKGRAPWEP